MVRKITVLLMMALLVLPACCCLDIDGSKQKKSSDDAGCGSECCVATGKTPSDPLMDPSGHDHDSNPCSCDMTGMALALPEEITRLDLVTEYSFSTEWQELTSAFHHVNKAGERARMDLSAFHPPDWDTCRDYCVYLI